MAGRRQRGAWAAGWAVVGLSLGLGAVGCSHKPDVKVGPGQANGDHGQTVESVRAKGPPVDPFLSQPFAAATTVDPPEGEQPPPDLTCSGKRTGQLFTEVQKVWDQVQFVNASGKPVSYTATIETELGTMEMQLYPEVAPNHVRNFVALARVGYYDGLVFERTVHETDGKTNEPLNWIEGGCPLGTGEDGYGSIGYWMRPDLDKTVSHEEGSVGAAHGEGLAACKFYVTLTKAPSLDGSFTVFGKITSGLDVAHKIFAMPVRQKDPEYPYDDRPVKPVVITKVTIHTAEGGKPAGELTE